jgi:hypothetical protein
MCITKERLSVPQALFFYTHFKSLSMMRATFEHSTDMTLQLWTPTIFIGKEQRINIYGTPSKVARVHLAVMAVLIKL